MIPPEMRPYYQGLQPFGPEVERVFPDAMQDTRAAGRCLALDEGTAAVFHLMGVLERALHRLASQIELLMTPTIELENWKTITDQIEKKINGQVKALEQQPKGIEKSAKMQFYSEIAIDFNYFRLAWRNHVAHGRDRYEPREALEIWNHVRSFMQRLAKRFEAESTIE